MYFEDPLLFVAVTSIVVIFLLSVLIVVTHRMPRANKTSLYDRVVLDYYNAEKTQTTPDLNDASDIEGKIAIVTGANVGLGRATVLELARKGAVVVMGCRDISKSTKALLDMKSLLRSDQRNNLALMKLDLGDFGSIKEFVSEFNAAFPHLNILINNAGVFDRSGNLPPTRDGFEPHIGINHLGHFLLTSLLIESLERGSPSRVVTLTSLRYALSTLTPDSLPRILGKRLGSVGAFDSEGTNYAHSKYANILFTKELGSRLEGRGVRTYCVCPGLVATNVFRNETWMNRVFTKIFLKISGMSPEEGCKTVLMCAWSKKLAEETGGMYRFGKTWENPLLEVDSDLAKALWSISEEITRAKFEKY
jgi:retinol dehydrogenase-14